MVYQIVFAAACINNGGMPSIDSPCTCLVSALQVLVELQPVPVLAP